MWRIPEQAPASAKPLPKNPTLVQLAAMTPLQLAQMDIALMNLRCAEGLRGAEGLDVAEALKKLDQYAKRVEQETLRHLYRFREHPEEYQDSEAYFRLMMMAVILQEDFKVTYNPKRIDTPSELQPNQQFYADAKDVFIHGLTGAPMMGTCSSLPVFYVAVGRRLGYPLFLVTTRNHLFVRWEEGETKLNVEATARGFVTYDDAHYRQWPFPVTEAEIQAHRYLKSLTPPEELACFLVIRGACLMNMKRYPSALVCDREAVRLAPDIRAHQVVLDMATQEADAQISAMRLRQIERVPWVMDLEGKKPVPDPTHLQPKRGLPSP
jgi:hypothetical protein